MDFDLTQEQHIFPMGQLSNSCKKTCCVGRASTLALTNPQCTICLKAGRTCSVQAIQENELLGTAVNVYKGKLTYKAAADALDLDSPLSNSGKAVFSYQGYCNQLLFPL